MRINDSYCVPINKSSIEFWPNEFDGIPDVLLINLVISVTILTIFLSMTALSWRDSNKRNNIYKCGWISLIYGDVYCLIPTRGLKRVKSTYKPLEPNMTYFQMMWHCFFKLTNEEIKQRCGIDALEYIRFLKCIIKYSMINTLLVIAIILPINFRYGDLERETALFARTTISNIDFRKSPHLWIHVFVALFLMILCFLIIIYFSSKLVKYKRKTWSEKTVLLRDIGHKPITSERIEKYLKDIIPSAEIEDIKLAYKYKNLIVYNEKLRQAEEALEICNHILNIEQRRVMVEDRCWFCPQRLKAPFQTQAEDGVDYYEEKVAKMRNIVARELSSFALRILRFAFVTFRDKQSALQLLKNKKKFPEVEDDKYWKIREAPDPGNILWKNLSRRGSNFSSKTLIINTSVFLIAVFMTTPTVIASSSGIIYITEALSEQGSIIRFLPTLITWILSVSVAALVTYSSGYLDFETKSKMNRSIMRKTVIFLIFSVVILPSLGLTSLSGFLEWTVKEDEEKFMVKWACVFLPDNGVFFISYVLTSAFIGNIIQLLRLSEVFFCFLGVLGSKSEAEKIPIRKSCIWDFCYGIQYSYSLLIFTLVLFFSVWFPVIAPAGLIYFLLKLLVDRYNIYFTCSPSRNCYKVHSLAIEFMTLALIVKIIGLFFLMYIRGANLGVVTTTQVIFWIALIIYFCSMNPCGFKFIPKCFIMPHKLRFIRTLEDSIEDENSGTEKEVFFPFALIKYADVISPADKYGNPLPTMQAQSIDSDELLEIFWRHSL